MRNSYTGFRREKNFEVNLNILYSELTKYRLAMGKKNKKNEKGK